MKINLYKEFIFLFICYLICKCRIILNLFDRLNCKMKCYYEIGGGGKIKGNYVD